MAKVLLYRAVIFGLLLNLSLLKKVGLMMPVAIESLHGIDLLFLVGFLWVCTSDIISRRRLNL